MVIAPHANVCVRPVPLSGLAVDADAWAASRIGATSDSRSSCSSFACSQSSAGALTMGCDGALASSASEPDGSVVSIRKVEPAIMQVVTLTKCRIAFSV